MEYTIQNEKLTVVISSKGGEFQSVKGSDGREYLWQGDEATWTDRGPNLFPYIARLTDGAYTYEGKEYHMDIHGFLMYSEMELISHEESKLVLGLGSSPKTKEQYPFDFSLEITWELKEEKAEVTYKVVNRDEKTMYFGIGGHPGFSLPLEDGLSFEDYEIDFGEKAAPVRVGMSDDCFVTGEDTPFALGESGILKLHHHLFDDDAIILREIPEKVTLRSKKGTRSVTVTFPDMNYLGIWHWPKTEVDYVCIEPWTSLPSRKGVVEALETQKNLISLQPESTYENMWSITVNM